jgi:hypothetical protein
MHLQPTSKKVAKMPEAGAKLEREIRLWIKLGYCRNDEQKEFRRRITQSRTIPVSPGQSRAIRDYPCREKKKKLGIRSVNPGRARTIRDRSSEVNGNKIKDES